MNKRKDTKKHDFSSGYGTRPGYRLTALWMVFIMVLIFATPTIGLASDAAVISEGGVEQKI